MDNQDKEYMELFIKTAAGTVPFKGIKEMHFDLVEDYSNNLKELKGLTEPCSFEASVEMDLETLCKVTVKNGDQFYKDMKELHTIASTMPFVVFSTVFDELVEKYNVPWQFALGVLNRLHEQEEQEIKNER